MTVSRRSLLSTLALLLPAAAAEAATKPKSADKTAKAAHKPTRRRRTARRHTAPKPAAAPHS